MAQNIGLCMGKYMEFILRQYLGRIQDSKYIQNIGYCGLDINLFTTSVHRNRKDLRYLQDIDPDCRFQDTTAGARAHPSLSMP